MAPAGDINKDGFDDFVVGAPETFNSVKNGFTGYARVISGKDGNTIHEFWGDLIGSKFGTAVAIAGDVNKDSYPDILVGAYIPGEILLYSGMDGSLIKRIPAPIANYKFGWSVAGIGDVNGDGYDDFAVGAPEEGQANEGALHVYSGRTLTLLVTLKGLKADGQYGWSVSGLGDVNGDMRPDFLVGIPYADDVAFDSGRAEVISGLDFSTLQVLLGQQEEEFFGYAVSSAGTVDGDSTPDILVGAPGWENSRGLARVISGKTGTVIRDLIGAENISRFGYSVSSVGDMDMDGHDDVAVVSPSDLKNGKVVGSLQVYSLKGMGRRLWISHGSEISMLGNAVSGIGDANQDGIPDVAAGLPWQLQKAVLFSGTDVTRVGVFTTGNPSITSTPWSIGNPFTLSGTNAPPSTVGYLFISFTPNLPLTIPPAFVIHIDPAQIILLTAVIVDNLGKWTFPLALPGDPKLIGFNFASQAGFPVAVPQGYKLTPGCNTHVNGPPDLEPPVIGVGIQTPLWTNKGNLDVPVTITDASSTFTPVFVNGKRVAESGWQNFWKIFTAKVPLAEGLNQIEVRSTDGANNVADPVVLAGITRDTRVPNLSRMVPAANQTLSTWCFPVSGESDEPLKRVTVNNRPVALGSGKTTFSGTYCASANGPLDLVWRAEDPAGNVTTLKIPVTVDVPGPPELPRIVSHPITSAAVGAEYWYEVVATHPRPGEKLVFSLPVAPSGAILTTLSSLTALIKWTPTQGPKIHPMTVEVVDQAFNKVTQPFEVNVVVPPPDPATVAPPLPKTTCVPVSEAVEFLYTGPNAIQVGVTPSAFDKRRCGAVHGKVKAGRTPDLNLPLAGVTVTVLDHPEFGRTLSRVDGAYDMAVNGGGDVILNFERPGFLPIQRTVKVPWLDHVTVPDVTMIPFDPHATEIDLTSTSGIQVAAGSVITDDAGTRQLRLFFKPGTQALMHTGKDTLPLTKMTVRATEYTVGAKGDDFSGMERMPAELPPYSGYTYAMALSVEPNVAVDSPTLTFSQAVPSYLDNFLDIPVGCDVPSGYYDRDRGCWVPSDNGRVIKILSVTGGLADLDIDGSSKPATRELLAALGIDDAERKKLAETYAVGKTLWRVPVTNFLRSVPGTSANEPVVFSVHDFNYFLSLAKGVIGPIMALAKDGIHHDSDNPCFKDGSVLAPENQVLYEHVPVVGTPYTLSYSSERTSGFVPSRSLRIPVIGSKLPHGTIRRIRLKVSIAGKKFWKIYPKGEMKTGLYHDYVWDGRDGLGRLVYGTRCAFIKIGYVYEAIRYATWQEAARSWARPRGINATLNTRRLEITLWKAYSVPLTHQGPDHSSLGLWSLDPHHYYDYTRYQLHYGDGRKRRAEALSPITDTVAGDGRRGHGGDGGPARQASLFYPEGIEVLSDGSILIADSGNHRIRRVDPEGKITSIAGNGKGGYGGNGLPATQASLNTPHDVAVGLNGSLYIADTQNNRIRCVSPDGIMSVFAGNGMAGFSGDGEDARDARLSSPRGVAVGVDGSVFIADTGNDRIRRVLPDGRIYTFAGKNGWGYNKDNIPAHEALLHNPTGVAVDPDGIVYIADSGNHRIRKVNKDGIITTAAGNGTRGFYGDLGPATDATLNTPVDIAVGLDGDLFIVDRKNRRIRKVDARGIIRTVFGNGTYGKYSGGGRVYSGTALGPRGVAVSPTEGLLVSHTHTLDDDRVVRVDVGYPEYRHTALRIADESGSVVYDFNRSGRHLHTLHALTGEKLLSFGYDTANLLVRIQDSNGNITSIIRTTTGVPTSIVGPYGQTTKLIVNTIGFLESVENPAGETHVFTYQPDGLLTKSRNPRGHTHTYRYHNGKPEGEKMYRGRLVQDDDPAEGFQILERSELSAGRQVEYTTTLGRKTQYTSEDDKKTGNRVRTIQHPDRTQSTSSRSEDDKVTVVHPDRSEVYTEEGPDPRFGMQIPVPAQYVVTLDTPSTLKMSSATRHDVILRNPDDPFSIVNLDTSVTTNGKIHRSRFNGLTNETMYTSPEGRTSWAKMDDFGKITTLRVPGLAPVLFHYDERGRLTSLLATDGIETRKVVFAYDTNGYLSSIIDPLSRVTSFEYDRAGRVTKQILPSQSEITFSYDLNGNVTSITPPGKPAHGFEYTPLDFESVYRPPSVGSWSPETCYTYNKDRQLTEILQPGGVKATYVYDNTSGRLSERILPSGTTKYFYDSSTGQLTTIQNPISQLTFSYEGFLPVKTTWTGPFTATVSQTYDNDFAVVSRSVNGGNTITFQYDQDKLLTAAGPLTLAYDQYNGLLQSTNILKVEDQYQYNGFGEVKQYSAAHNGVPVFSTSFTRDLLGRINSKTETVLGSIVSWNYYYDLDGRLTTVFMGSLRTVYEYDSNGNRTTVTKGSTKTTATYDDQDRLLTYGQRSFTYTKNGELLTITENSKVTSLRYCMLGNLLGVTLPSGKRIEYLLDGQGRRIGKKVDGVFKQGWIYKDGLNPIAELDDKGQIVSRFVYAGRFHVPDFMISTKGGTLTTFRIISDYLGSVRLVVDAVSGKVAQQIDYDEFGVVLQDTNPGFQPFGFAGGLYDHETKLIRFGARDYYAPVARWTGKDPIAINAVDKNLYIYSYNDSVNWTDIAGLSPLNTPCGTNGRNPRDKERDLLEQQRREKCRRAIAPMMNVADNLGYFGLGSDLFSLASGISTGSMNQAGTAAGNVASGMGMASVSPLLNSVSNKMPGYADNLILANATDQWVPASRLSRIPKILRPAGKLIGVLGKITGSVGTVATGVSVGGRVGCTAGPWIAKKFGF